MNRDRNWLKCLVCFLLLADTVDAVFVIVYVYDALIIHFGKSAGHLLISLIPTRIPQQMWIILQRRLGVRTTFVGFICIPPLIPIVVALASLRYKFCDDCMFIFGLFYSSALPARI